MNILKLALATLAPALLAVSFFVVQRRTRFQKLSDRAQQGIIGVVFGLAAIGATEFGVPLNMAVVNVRTAAPMTAGLLFGPWAGIIAGILGGVERWFSVYWGGGMYTRLACTLATILAGFFAAFMRKYIFDNQRISGKAGFVLGLTMEVFHMLLVFLTNMSDIHTAFEVVDACATVMIPLNAISVALALSVVSRLKGEKKKYRKEEQQITQIFRRGLMQCVILAFAGTCLFTIVFQAKISNERVINVLKTELEDVSDSLQKLSDTTYQLYVRWIADDLSKLESVDAAHLKMVADDYSVSEIMIVDADGRVIMDQSGVEKEIHIPKEYILSAEAGIKLWDYGTSVLDTKVSMKYGGVPLEEGRVLLVGFGEKFVSEEIQSRMESMAENRQVGQNGFVMICDESWKIISDNQGHTGESAYSLGLMDEFVQEKKLNYTKYDQTSVTTMYRILPTVAGNYIVIAVYPDREESFASSTAVTITAYMEIVVFTILFINVYFMTKHVVVDNIHKINNSLTKITGGDLEEKADVRDNIEFASLTDDINSTVSTLKTYIEEAKARIDQELELAREIQLSALPSVFPPYPNRTEFDIYALMDTAKEVGGDFYDFCLLGNDRLYFLIADVSGKGIPAAMFMMNAKSVIKGLAESGLEVHDIFHQANEKLYEGNDAGMFVTAWIGILDLHTGQLNFANAGHNPPLVRRAGGTFEYLRTKPNIVLGVVKNVGYKKEELKLAPGDEMFLYTDGVTEAPDKYNELFQEERLQNILNQSQNEGVEQRCKNLLGEIEQFSDGVEQFDDITMLTVKLNHLDF